MNKVKTIYKIQTIILLAVMLCLIVCLTIGGTASADTNLPVINLENCEEKLENDDLFGYAGVVTDKDCIRENKAVFDDYINNQYGKVIIPERDNESNVLAYQLVGFEKTGMLLYPLYSYGEVDKSQIEYSDLLFNTANLSVLDGDAYDFMSTTITFYVYSKNYLNKYLNIASVKIKMSVDFFPAEDALYNYYVAKYEVCVMPWKKAGVKGFVMSTVVSKDVYMDEYKTMTNNVEGDKTHGITFNTGIKSGVKIDENGITVEKGKEVSLGFNYSFSAPSGSSTLKESGVTRFDQFEATDYQLRPNHKIYLGSGKFGDRYSGLIYKTYRVQKSNGGGLVGLRFDRLDLRGDVGQSSFDLENTETIMILAAWENVFSNRKIMLMSGNVEGEDKTTQYYEDFSHSSSLPNESSIFGMYIYSD